jgi:hypothetical protein
VTVAVAALPVPVDDVTLDVTLFFTPLEVAVTGAWIVQVPPAGSVAFASTKTLGVTDSVPSQLLVADPLTSCNPEGMKSLNVASPTASDGLGFVNVKFNVVVAPTATVDGENALVSVGG